MVDDLYDDTFLRREVMNLQRQMRELSGRVDALPKAWRLDQRRELKSAIDKVGRELGDRIDHIDTALDDRIAKVRDEHGQARTNLERRLRWIERHIRAAAGAANAQIDPTADIFALAERAEQARTLRTQLLEPSARAAQSQTASAWTNWQKQHRQDVMAAIAASRTIAATVPGESGRSDAESAFRTAHSALDDLEARRDHTRRASETAAQQLARDEALHNEHASEIAQGEQAWETLKTWLRAQLVDSVGRAHLFPVWFDTVLGQTPPPNADAWLETGVELLAYRATYGIDDAVVALGPSPSSDFTGRQLKWYSRLTSMLSDYH